MRTPNCITRIRRGLGQRSKGLLKNPRHFAQLALPTTLVLLGWLALAFDWRRLGFLLVSAALMVFAGLLWMRLRRLQTRIDSVLRRTAALQAQTLELRRVERPAAALVTETTSPDDARAPHEGSALPELAMAAGVPAGLLTALEQAAPSRNDSCLLVVPASARDVSTRWARGITGMTWRTVDENPDNGLQRGHAAELAAAIIVDTEDETDFGGVLDQSFFWWLPRSAKLFVVSDDVSMCASRLATAHGVEFAVAEAWPSAARIVVTRAKEALE